MCKVIVKNTSRSIPFIVYNHIFSKNNYTFTIGQLLTELQEYNLNLSEEYLKNTIKTFVRSGIVHQYVNYYAVFEK